MFFRVMSLRPSWIMLGPGRAARVRRIVTGIVSLEVAGSVATRRPKAVVTWIALLLTFLVYHPCRGEQRTGEQLYHKLCVKCHGRQGEGSDEDYPHPLVGDRPVPELAQYIAKSMPEDDPGTCVGEDANRVATYVYDTFYSPAAQSRNKPPRIELARLTVRQFRQVVADLIGSFRSPGQWDERRGLQAEYFKSRQFRNDHRVLERLDPVVQFDFAESSPDPAKIEPPEFAIRWQGSVLAPESGEYEFVLKTENGARLWVNDTARPLIDAWVKSGSGVEHRGAIQLLGGRHYPLRLEFFKSKEGKERRASVALQWKLPHRAVELVPQRVLSPNRVPEAFVLQTPFPPDDRSLGYERGTSISKAWDQATTDAAIEVAGYVVAHLRELSGVAEDAADRNARLREFSRRFVERACRRPLTDQLRQAYVDRQFDRAPTPETAVKRVMLLTLKSPRFLYREAGRGQADSFDTAARVSFGLWDSLPDQPLWEAASTGQLVTRDQVFRHIERMLPDLRSRAKIREFFLQWLKVDLVPDLSKDSTQYPEFTPSVASDLRTSLDLFLEDIVWSEASDFRQLLLAESVPLNGRLAKFYGVDLPVDTPFQKTSLGSQDQAGVLSHPYLLAHFAYTATSSPIHRGVFIARSVLGRSLRPPPIAVAPLAADLHAGLTTRERVALQTKPEACQMCHAMINPLGFTLEHFDAIGRYRGEEHGKPIDATGTYLTPAGDVVQFAGVRDLAAYLARSEETHAAFVDQFFHYLVKQPIRAYGSRERQCLQQAFAKNDYSIRKLAVEIIATAALPGIEEPPKSQ